MLAVVGGTVRSGVGEVGLLASGVWEGTVSWDAAAMARGGVFSRATALKRLGDMVNELIRVVSVEGSGGSSTTEEGR